LPSRTQLPEALPFVHYTALGMEDLHLGYPAYFNPRHETHTALAALNPGDRLGLCPEGDAAVALTAANGVVVARLSRKAAAEWRERLHQVREVRVLALIQRTAEQEPDPSRRQQFRTTRWEIPIVELVHSPAQKPSERCGSQA
jgi:ATP-dependent DNA helicase RecQ